MSVDPQLPKTQVEISTGQEELPLNRGTMTSRASDTVKDFTVTLRDIDAAVRYYVVNVIKPKVEENGMTVDVPVIYANPERWKSVQRDGFFKDEKDKIILPIIAFKRNTVSKDDNYAIDKMDANNPLQFYSFKKKWSANNRYDNFSISVNTKPTEELFNVVIPDYVTMTYDFLVLTEAVDQMNKIVEAILYSEGSYWGDKERFKFRTKIQSYNTSIDSVADTQRTVKTTFNLEISGYLVPATINKTLALAAGSVEKQFSPKQVIFGTTIID